jgi:hypothetical protein
MRRGGPGSDRRGTARVARQWSAAARPRRAWAARRVRIVGRRRVTDEWGLTRSGRGREERQARGARGPTWERRGGPSLDEQ